MHKREVCCDVLVDRYNFACGKRSFNEEIPYNNDEKQKRERIGFYGNGIFRINERCCLGQLVKMDTLDVFEFRIEEKGKY